MTLSTTPAEAGRLGHLSLIQWYRECPSWSRGGVSHEEGGCLCYASDTAFPVMFNGVFRTDDQADPGSVLERAEAFFAARGRGFSVWVREGADEDLGRAALGAGLAEVLSQPEMVICWPLAARPLPDGVEVRRVETVEDVRRFVEINASAYTSLEIRPKAFREAFSAPGGLLRPDIAAAVAFVEGTPAATALTFVSHGAGLVNWVGTLAEYRGRGVGEAVTREVTNAGFDLGARASTLQASPMGEPIYRRLGYETAFRYRVYVRSRKRG